MPRLVGSTQVGDDMNEFMTLYKAGRVKRYHTCDVPAQELGQHSWGVAMIVHAIYPNHNPPGYLLMDALTHDLAESFTGDVPAPAKWASIKLSEALEEMEARFNHTYNIGPVGGLNPKEVAILRWADTFELVLYCRNVRTGDGVDVFNAGMEVLRESGFPTTEAKELYESIFGQ